MKVIASLSENAWVFDSRKKLDYILSYYILSDAAQSLLFQDKIINLPETYYKYINDPNNMKLGIKSDLEKLLGRYFNFIEVVTEIKKITDSKIAILLHVAVIDDDGVKYELSKITQINESLSRTVTDVSNYGDGLSMLNNL